MHTLIASFLWSSRSLGGARFPQVRRLITSAWYAGLLLPCYPRVRAFISRDRMKWWNNLVGLFDESAETLEEIDEFVMSPDTVKCMFL
jgi:hypothetical protein